MKLRKKQTSIIVITITAIVIFAWQVYLLMSNDISSNNSSSVSIAAPIETPMEKTAILTSNKVESAPPPTVTSGPMQAITALQRHKVTNKNPYLTLVNNYKLAKMKHQVLQEELAIANVRHKIALLNEKTLSTDDNDARTNFGGFGIQSANSDKSEIKLVYLDYQNNQWSATLKNGNRFSEINAGAQLSDGSHIIAINRHGVLIQSGSHRYNLSFNGITPLPNQSKSPFATTTKTNLFKKASSPKKAAKPKSKSKSMKTQKAKSTQRKTAFIEQKIIHHKVAALNPSYPAALKKLQVKAVTAQKLVIPMVVMRPTELPIKKHTTQKPITPKIPSKIKTVSKPIEKNKTTALLKPPVKLNHQVVLKPTQPPKKIKHTLDETVLLEMPAKSYTIWLKSSANKKELDAFAKKYHIDGRTLCYSNKSHPEPYYTLVYGDYLTTRAAKSALDTLPGLLHQKDLSIQSLGQIQNQIR